MEKPCCHLKTNQSFSVERYKEIEIELRKRERTKNAYVCPREMLYALYYTCARAQIFILNKLHYAHILVQFIREFHVLYTTKFKFINIQKSKTKSRNSTIKKECSSSTREHCVIMLYTFGTHTRS